MSFKITVMIILSCVLNGTLIEIKRSAEEASFQRQDVDSPYTWGLAENTSFLLIPVLSPRPFQEALGGIKSAA